MKRKQLFCLLNQKELKIPLGRGPRIEILVYMPDRTRQSLQSYTFNEGGVSDYQNFAKLDKYQANGVKAKTFVKICHSEAILRRKTLY